MTDQFKPPAKPSQLRWIFWKDHSKDQTADKDAPVIPRELNKSIGWFFKEDAECTQEAYCISSTGEIDFLKIGKQDIVDIQPVIKSRKAKEQLGK